MDTEAPARLRRIASGQDGPEDRAWLADRLGCYLDGAAGGVRLDEALGLAVAPGGEPWWRAEARERRNAAYRELAHRFYPGCTIGRQAAEIVTTARRYEASAWRWDRRLNAMPLGYEGTPRQFLFEAFKAYPVGTPGQRQLRTILSQRTEGN